METTLNNFLYDVVENNPTIDFDLQGSILEALNIERELGPIVAVSSDIIDAKRNIEQCYKYVRHIVKIGAAVDKNLILLAKVVDNRHFKPTLEERFQGDIFKVLQFFSICQKAYNLSKVERYSSLIFNIEKGENTKNEQRSKNKNT